ncbi:syntaxin-like protein [Thelephora terrestris]|uniref:Syntaxin-like protein n=1 Tax=Thelephora terrestris TaxID=56493 RepID=A0A9P6HI12_9AGAM|nr:syntaxin-like protein [Thelephora terrestris]
MSLAKLTSLSTQTLSLLLERQRIQSLPTSPGASASSLHLRQITKNLQQLRAGILELRQTDGSFSEAANLLSGQYDRMRAMLGPDADANGITVLERPIPEPPTASSPPRAPSPAPGDIFTPYTDDPDGSGYESNEMMLHSQRRIIDEQDGHLEHLSQSISRQHHISLQINDELDTHTGLLEGLDHDLDRTQSRMSNARRRLERVARGAKANGSSVTIALLILILLLLIIILKT